MWNYDFFDDKWYQHFQYDNWVSKKYTPISKLSCHYNSILFFSIGAPFLMYSIVLQYVIVSAKGMLCSVFLIIMVLVAVTSILACSKRKLSTIVGFIFIIIYILFVIVSLAFAYKWVECPV